MGEYRVQRRRANKFKWLRESETEVSGLKVVHGPLRSSGEDVVQSFVLLASSIWEAKQVADLNWELSVATRSVNKVMELIESAISTKTGITVDTEASVIRGVKVLGMKAETKRRRYTEAALKTAAESGMFNNVSVNVDHDKAGEVRPVRDRLGKTANVRYVPGEGLRGDIRYNPDHPVSKQVAWFAANMPEALCMSPVSVGAVRMENGVEVVHTIQKVKSVDIVSDGGTTKSLFEDAGDDCAQDADTIASVIDSDLSTAAKVRRIKELRESSEPAPSRKKKGRKNMHDDDSDISGLTLATLKESRPDLFEAMKTDIAAGDEVKTLKESNTKLQAQLDEINATNAKAARKTSVLKLLKESKLPEHAITDPFVDLCINETDDGKLKLLIEDRRKVTGQVVKPQAKEQTMGEATGREDGKDISMKDFANQFKSM